MGNRLNHGQVRRTEITYKISFEVRLLHKLSPITRNQAGPNVADGWSEKIRKGEILYSQHHTLAVQKDSNVYLEAMEAAKDKNAKNS